jgi:DNA polymerase III delta prime subunit
MTNRIFDLRHLYYPFLRNYFDKTKYCAFNKKDKILNTLILMNNINFPEILEFIQQSFGSTESYDAFFSDINHRASRAKLQLIAEKIDFDKAHVLIQSEYLSLKENFNNSELLYRMSYLMQSIGLNSLELDAVALLIITKKIKNDISLLPCLTNAYLDLNKRGDIILSKKQILSLLGEDTEDEEGLFSSESLVIKCELIKDEFYGRLCVSEKLYNYVCDKNASAQVLHQLEINHDQVYDIETFHLEASQIFLIQQLLQSSSPAIILLLGPPGVGKSAFANSIAHKINKTPLFMPIAIPSYEDGLNRRKSSLLVASQMISPEHNIVIADEADDLIDSQWSYMRSMLGNSQGNKEYVNNLFDRNKSKLILIVNNLSLDESSLRRINLILRFEKPPRETRASMVMNTLQANHASHFLTQEEINDLVIKQDISQAMLAMALRDSIACSKDFIVQKRIFKGLIRQREVFSEDKNRKRIGII